MHHTGIHIDAPYHFIAEGKRIDELPLEWFMREAVILDVSPAKPRQYVTLDDIKMAEKESGEIKEDEAAVIYTDWEERLGKDEYLTDNPGLSGEAAEYLVSRGVCAVRMDVASIDHPSEGDFPAHNILLGSGVLVIENLRNLGAIGEKRFKLVALPPEDLGRDRLSHQGGGHR